MSERKTEEEKINEKRSFLQKILGFRFTPSISAWKLAIALFLLIAIAYAVNGAGIIAKGDNLEVSGNATVQGKIGIGTISPGQKLSIANNNWIGWVNGAGSATWTNLVVDPSNNFFSLPPREVYINSFVCLAYKIYCEIRYNELRKSI